MIERAHVIGAGRVGSAFAARLRERGLSLGPDGAQLIILCVPDRAIAAVAAEIEPGPWIAHVSGATSLTALAPHRLRFGVHPLQTLTRERGAEQLDGAWAAIGGESADALARARWLAGTLGLRPFEIADADHALYHAAAVFGGNYVVTLHDVATRLLTEVGAPAEAIVPLMARTIENGFDLTGPIARGDWATVEAHLATLEERAPDLVPLYRALADATRR